MNINTLINFIKILMTIHCITIDFNCHPYTVHLSVLYRVILCYLRYDKWVLLNEYEWMNESWPLSISGKNANNGPKLVQKSYRRRSGPVVDRPVPGPVTKPARSLIVRLVLEYACPVWHSGLTAGHCNAIENIEKRAIRMIYSGTDSDYKIALYVDSMDSLKDRR